MKMKTVIVGSGAKGGSGKTFALVMLAYCLRRLGYRLHLIDADSSNRTFSKVFAEEAKSGQVTLVNLDVDGEFQKSIEACAKLDDNVVTLIDMPGSKIEFFVEFFKNKKSKDFEMVGIRLIFAIITCNTAVALQGVREIARICMGAYPVLAVKSNMADAKGVRFDLKNSNTGNALMDLAMGRVIEVPQLGGLQKQEYDQLPAPPNEYEISGRAALKLGLTHLSAINWMIYGNAMLDNVLPHAEWITGMPIPDLPKSTASKAQSTNEPIDNMDDDDL